jgi:hypothetical protein
MLLEYVHPLLTSVTRLAGRATNVEHPMLDHQPLQVKHLMPCRFFSLSNPVGEPYLLVTYESKGLVPQCGIDCCCFCCWFCERRCD